MEASLYIALILGLSSSFHCVGMCGPIAMAIPANRKNNWTLSFGILSYNLGRILTYAILGLIVGNIGLSLTTFGIMQWISILAGIGLILFAWKKVIGRIIPFSGSSKLTSLISQNIGKVMRSNSPFKLPLLGMLNGLLPCGMVYVALTNAILAGNPINGALSMLFFGLGTIPAMFAIAFFANKITGAVRQKINTAIPYILTVVGFLVVLRGMNLDIPYISPKVQLTEMKADANATSNVAPKQEVKMSCCHSKETCE